MRCGPQLEMSLSAFTDNALEPLSDLRALFHFNRVAAAAAAVDIGIKHLKMQKYLCAC